MAQLKQVHVTNNAFNSSLQYVSTLGILVCLLTTLLGIKVWWFKRRLTFDGTQHDLPSDSFRAVERDPVINRARSSMPRKVNHKRSQQQYDEPVTVHGVFRKREEQECENDIVTTSQLPPVRQPISIRKKPSFFRTLTGKPSQKIHDTQTRSAILTTATQNPFQNEEISTNDVQFNSLNANVNDFSDQQKTKNNFNFKRATLPLTRTMPIITSIPPMATRATLATTAETTPSIEMLAVPENEPDAFLHASIIPLNGVQPMTDPQQQQQPPAAPHKQMHDQQQQFSSSPSLSSLSSLERFSSFSSNFDIVQHNENPHQHDNNKHAVTVHAHKSVDVQEFIEPEIFKKMSKVVLEPQHEKNYNNNNNSEKKGHANNNLSINSNEIETQLAQVNLDHRSEVDILPEKPPRKQDNINVKPIEKTFAEIFEQATSSKAFDNEAERLSIDFGTDSDELDEIQTGNNNMWEQFSWGGQAHNNYNGDANNVELWLQQTQQQQQQQEKEVEDEVEEEDRKQQQIFQLQQQLMKLTSKKNVIENQDEQQQQHHNGKENSLINDNINNAFGKSIDEDWENFEKLAQIPTTIITTTNTLLTSMPIMDNVTELLTDKEESNKINAVIEKTITATSSNRKMSRGNLKVTFDLEDHFLPAASNNYESDSSSNDSRHDLHTIRKSYVNALTKDAAKILNNEEDVIKLPLPLSSPPILTLTYYDEDEDDDEDDDHNGSYANYHKKMTNNDDSIMSVNIKPLENMPMTTNRKTAPKARPRTTVQVHHTMHADLERSTEA